MFAPTRLRRMLGYWSWLAWTLGEGAWKGYAPFDQNVRPSVPRKIPRAWWERRADFLAARRAKRPSPVRPPAPKPTPAPDAWTGRGLFVTQMRASELPPAPLALRARTKGYSYVACQFEDSPACDERLVLCASALRSRSVRFVIWDSYPDPYRVARAMTFRPDGYIAQSEGARLDWAGIEAALRCPGAVVTNFSGLHGLTLARWACMPECYLPENPSARVDGMVAEARRQGFDRVIPVLGCYWGKTLNDYGPPTEFAVWTAETLWLG